MLLKKIPLLTCSMTGQTLARDIQAVNLTVTSVSCNGTVLEPGSPRAIRHHSEGRPFQDFAEEPTEPGGLTKSATVETRLAKWPEALSIFLGECKGSVNGNIIAVKCF